MCSAMAKKGMRGTAPMGSDRLTALGWTPAMMTLPTGTNGAAGGGFGRMKLGNQTVGASTQPIGMATR